MLVLWSGGLDSTLALFRVLHGFGRDGGEWATSIDERGKRNFAHRTLAIDWDQQQGQRWMARARRRAGKLLRAGGFAFGESMMTFRSNALVGAAAAVQLSGTPSPFNSRWSPQATTWIAIASAAAMVEEDVVVSWIMDDGLERLDRLRAAFDALQHASAKTGKLVTPLVGYTKADVLCELRAASVKGLEEASWYCENGYGAEAKARFRAGEPCGNCQKCDEVATARWKIANLPRHIEVHGKPEPVDEPRRRRR